MIQTRTVRITDERLGQFHRYWTSLEGENPSGSIKDRMVEPELSSKKDKFAAIAEISSGSTALAISYYAMKFKLHCRLFVPKGIDPLIKKQLLSRGATVIVCEPSTAYAEYNEYIKKAGNKVWPFGQMERPELAQHYKLWAKSLLEPLLPPIDYVIGGVGTGHSLTGITQGLNPAEGCYSVEPASGTTVNGIRNVTLQNFGPSDPWKPSLFASRTEAALTGLFDIPQIETDQGLIYVSESFKLVLEGVINLNKNWKEPKNIFIVGSHGRRIIAVKNS